MMRRQWPLLPCIGLSLLLLSFCCWPAAGAEEGSAAGAGGASKQASDVVELITDNFPDWIERQTVPSMVLFVVRDKCESCKQIVPVVEKVAVNLKGIATVGKMDCNDVLSVRTCRAYNTHSFPKLLVFKPGTKVNPYTGGSMKDFADVNLSGAVSAKSLISAVTDTLDATHLAQLRSPAQQQSFLSGEPQLSKVLLFTDKEASTVLAKGLSWAYARRLAFAEVRPSSEGGKDLAQQYKVEHYPTLLLIKAGGGHEVYGGSLKAPELRTFLDGHARAEPLLEGPDAAAGKGLRDPLSQLVQVSVHSLDLGNLTSIDQQADMWLIAFYATAGSAGCDSQLESLRKLLVEVQGIVSYGTFNTTGVKPELLEPYGLDVPALSATPCSLQLVLLPYGEFKQAKGTFSRWSGALDDAKALQEWILTAVPDFTVPLTNEMEAQGFMDAGFADLPKPPKISSAAERSAPIGRVFLYTSKAEAPGIYKALAMQFTGKSRLLFAWCQVTTDGPAYPLMQKMNVRKPPAMTMMFPLPPKPIGADNDEVPNNPRDNMAMQQYMGPLKFQKMLGWLTAMSTLTGMAYKSHAGATKGPAPEDFEIRTQAQLQAACYDQPGLCLITLLDGRSEAANKHRDIVKQAAAAHRGQPVNWVVIDVSRQPSLRRSYGFTSDQLPALLALSTKRMRFAQGAAPFSEESAKQLVTKVLMGTAVTLPLPDLPRLVDGGEVEEDVVDVQEEFKLDEVMAEEVKELIRKEEKLRQADEEMLHKERQKKQGGKKKKKKRSSKKKSSTSKKKGGSSSKGASTKQKSVKDEL